MTISPLKHMYLLCVCLPLLGALSGLLFGSKVGKERAVLLTVVSVLVSFILSVLIFYEVGICRSPCIMKVFTIFEISNYYIDVSFLFDTITAVMLVVVTFVSLLVHFFSVEYMNSDPHFVRFMSYLSLFTFFMLILVTSGNLVQFFMGWEGVGLSSYLLINFWFTRREANKASMKAVIVNRIGDCGLIIAMAIMFAVLGTSDFCSIFSLLKASKGELFTYYMPVNVSGVSLNEFSFAVKEMFSGIVYMDFCILFDKEHDHWLEAFYDRLISFWVNYVIIFQYWFWLVSSWWPAWGEMFYDTMLLSCSRTNIDVYYFNEMKTSIFNKREMKVNSDLLVVSLVLVVIAASAKSAQLGLHTWLVDAMEGPTPVSALIHAATMVTAGVFLLVRMSPVLSVSPWCQNIILFLGSLTALISSITAAHQSDIKKLIAYSTVSQIGFMFMACGCGKFNGAMFHLTTHACFKALLFLCAGVVIYKLGDEQDMRKMGVLVKYMPFTYVMFLMGSFALLGFPFLSGYYSKEFILESMYTNNSYFNILCFIMGMSSTFFTVLYSMKALFFVFLIPSNGVRLRSNSVSDPESKLMIISLLCLSLGSVFAGYFLKDLFVGLGSDFWISSVSENMLLVETKYMPWITRLLPFYCFLFILYYMVKQRILNEVGSWPYLVCYTDNIRFWFIDSFEDSFYEWLRGNWYPIRADWSRLVYQFELVRLYFRVLWKKEKVHPKLPTVRDASFFVYKNFFFDYFYNKLVVYPYLRIGYQYAFKLLDRGIIEKVVGPIGAINIWSISSRKESESVLLWSFLYSIYTMLVLVLAPVSKLVMVASVSSLILHLI